MSVFWHLAWVWLFKEPSNKMLPFSIIFGLMSGTILFFSESISSFNLKISRIFKSLSEASPEKKTVEVKEMNEFALSDKGKKARNKYWEKAIYEEIFELLNTKQFKFYKTDLKPFITQIQKEYREIEKKEESIETKKINAESRIDEIKNNFVQLGCEDDPGPEFWTKLHEVLEMNEKVEYIHTSVGSGQSWFTTKNGLLLTNKQLIYFDVSLSYNFTALNYLNINSIKKGFAHVKFSSSEGYIKIPNEKKNRAVVSMIEEKVSAIK